MSVATFDRHSVAGRAAFEAIAAKSIAIAENRRRLRRIK